MKTYQRIMRDAPEPRSNPAGKSAVLQSPILAECWNFTTGKQYTLHRGQRIKVNHVYDAEHFTCTAVNETGNCDGIELEPGTLGYRFIIPNHALRKACPDIRPIPRKNFDLIGAIIAAES